MNSNLPHGRGRKKTEKSHLDAKSRASAAKVLRCPQRCGSQWYHTSNAHLGTTSWKKPSASSPVGSCVLNQQRKPPHALVPDFAAVFDAAAISCQICPKNTSTWTRRAGMIVGLQREEKKRYAPVPGLATADGEQRVRFGCGVSAAADSSACTRT